MLAVAPSSAHSATPIVLEEAPCPSCGGEQHESILSAREPGGLAPNVEFHVVRCCGCGLHFTNPRPAPDSMGAFYPDVYRPHCGKANRLRPLRGWYPRDWLRLPATKNPRPRLLDFGCGAGHFLSAMDRQGWEVAGLDTSEAAVRAIRQEIGLPASIGSLPHDELEPATFDLVTMWHALEHVHHPKEILREARRLLAPGGRLIVAVPNFGGWPRRWFGSSWYGLDVPRHLSHFDAESLRRILVEAGFRVLGLRHSRHADWLRSSACRARRENRPSFPLSLCRSKPVARFVAWICQRARKSEAIIALAEPK